MEEILKKFLIKIKKALDKAEKIDYNKLNINAMK